MKEELTSEISNCLDCRTNVWGPVGTRCFDCEKEYHASYCKDNPCDECWEVAEVQSDEEKEHKYD